MPEGLLSETRFFYRTDISKMDVWDPIAFVAGNTFFHWRKMCINLWNILRNDEQT